MPRGLVAGPSCWTYKHVKAAVNGCSEADTAAIKFVTAIVQGNLPEVPALLEASLIPVEKAGGGIRPIAMGEAMVSACLPVCARWLPGCWAEPETLVAGCWCGWGAQMVMNSGLG
jgi:hypothetical protein